MKRYDYGYKGDEWGMNVSLQLIEKENGPMVLWEDAQKAIEAAKRDAVRPMYWVAAGMIDAEVFAERLACSKVCEDFMKEHSPGQLWFAGNIISSRILGRSGKVENLHPQLPDLQAKSILPATLRLTQK